MLTFAERGIPPPPGFVPPPGYVLPTVAKPIFKAPPADIGESPASAKQAGPGQAEAVRWSPPVPPAGYAASHLWETGPPGPPPLDAPPQPEWDHWEPERSRQALEAWWKALAEAHSRRTGAGSSGDA